MLHRLRTDDPRGDALLTCRWDTAERPLAIAIEAPVISEELAGAVRPMPPESYVAAVERAIARFERLLEGAIRVTRAVPENALLRLRLLGEVGPAPEADLAVLGTTALGGACTRREGTARAAGASEVLPVHYEVHEVRVYVADSHGLLTPDQVERVALHELGHALGMRGHSPIPADAMYEMASDRDPRVDLSAQDARSFRALYDLPNGTVYAWLPRDARAITPAPAAPPPADSASLGLADEPTIVARDGVALRLPAGWRSAPWPHGIVAVDGETWDYEASLQLSVQAEESPTDWVARHRERLVGPGFLRAQSHSRVAGRPALRLEVEGLEGNRVAQVTAIELPSKRLAVVIADAPASRWDAWRPLLEASLSTLTVAASPPVRLPIRP